MTKNAYYQILDKEITFNTILIYKGTKITGYTNAPCFFNAVGFCESVNVVFWDGTSATVDGSELEVKK